MKTANLEPDGRRAENAAGGRVSTNRAGSDGITITDASGNEVDQVTNLRVPWVQDLDDHGALIGSEIATVFTNDAGATLAAGDVVVIVDVTVVTTITPQDTRPVGVVILGGDDGEEVIVQTSGVVTLVNVTAAVTANSYAETSTTAAKATESVVRRAGSFGIYLTAGTAPSALLFGIPDPFVGADSTTVFRGCSLRHSTTVSAATSGTHYAMLMDTEVYDTDNFHFTSDANLSGTVAKAATSPVIVGTGTSFTTELSVNQVISIPGTATEIGVVRSIASNTSLTLWQNMANTATGQTAARRNRYVGIPAGLGGYYFLTASTQWVANATGSRTVGFGKNQLESVGNFNLLGAQRLMAANNSSAVIVGAWSPPTLLVEGDYVYAGVRQDSGGALNFGDATFGWLTSQFSITRMG